MTHPGFIPSYTIPNVAHPIPGFIPLFPVGQAATPTSGLQAQGRSEAAGTPTPLQGSATADQIPLTPLDALSDDQLKYLEENTRRGLQERLRVLQAVESQIAESVSVLNRVLGALPPVGTPFQSETVDPPSPTMPSTSNSSAPSAGPNGTARNWVFGSTIGPVLNTNSPVGLQPLARGIANGASPNGCVNGAVNGNSNADVSVPSTTEPKTTVTVSQPEIIPPTTALPFPMSSSVAAVALNGGHEHEGEAAESMTTTTTAATTADNSKGKGRKSDADLEQDLMKESYPSYREQEPADIEDSADDDDDEDSKFSPQEMVRRRWAQSDLPSSE
jgi:hypothetical protein